MALQANIDSTSTIAGAIDRADYAVRRAHFGMTAGAGSDSLAAVPEPMASTTAIAGLLTLLSTGRKTR
jgi:hypothetical protein